MSNQIFHEHFWEIPKIILKWGVKPFQIVGELLLGGKKKQLSFLDGGQCSPILTGATKRKHSKRSSRDGGTSSSLGAHFPVYTSDAWMKEKSPPAFNPISFMRCHILLPFFLFYFKFYFIFKPETLLVLPNHFTQVMKDWVFCFRWFVTSLLICWRIVLPKFCIISSVQHTKCVSLMYSEGRKGKYWYIVLESQIRILFCFRILWNN